MLKTIKESDPRITGEAWKTQDRKAVEAVLNNAAAMGTALTPHQIASLSNVILTAALERKDALLRQALGALSDFDYDKRVTAVRAITKELQ